MNPLQKDWLKRYNDHGVAACATSLNWI